MLTAIQYLEGGSHIAHIAPEEARTRLRMAFERLPPDMVLLGWNLPTVLVQVVMAECARAKAQLYLWQPLLTGGSGLRFQLDWQTIGLNNNPVGGFRQMPEFTFVCPNRPAAREAILQRLDEVLSHGEYQGVFLDRIRFPSPAADPTSDLACFCEDCRRAAEQQGLDLILIQRQLRQLLNTPEGRRVATSSLLSMPNTPEMQPGFEALAQFLAFRQRSISEFVRMAVTLARAHGLAVGLDCFSPTLTRLVGQDLSTLSGYSDWIKVMTYIRAFGPATIPFEVSGLINWLVTAGGVDEPTALTWLAEATGWDLPHRGEILRRGLSSFAILTAEINRGRAACSRRLLAGVELVEMPGVSELSSEQIKADVAAVRAAGVDGLVLSWDLWHIPLERLELLGSR